MLKVVPKVVFERWPEQGRGTVRPVCAVGKAPGEDARTSRRARRDHPDAVRQVITLGTPFRLDSIDQLAGGPLFKALSFLYDPAAMSIDDLRAEQAPLHVPSTSIYCRTDVFVPWQLCDQGQGARHESVEVRGSHLGLGHNPAALAVVANRLAQPEEHWSPFVDTTLSRMVSPRNRPERHSTRRAP